jgi:acyl transferase domain-containing protein
LDVRDPAITFVSGSTAAPVATGDAVARAFVDGILSPVRWREVQERLVALGVTHLVEAGPGGVLAGLAKRTIPDVTAHRIETPDDLGDLVAALQPDGVSDDPAGRDRGPGLLPARQRRQQRRPRQGDRHVGRVDPHTHRDPPAARGRAGRGHLRPGSLAGKAALADAGLGVEDISALVVATTTPDHPIPGTAPLTAAALGTEAAAFDVNAACSGFVYGLRVGGAMAATGDGAVLVIGAETLTRVVDPQDRSVRVLFGDGAGAVVLVPDEAHPSVRSTWARMAPTRRCCGPRPAAPGHR